MTLSLTEIERLRLRVWWGGGGLVLGVAAGLALGLLACPPA